MSFETLRIERGGAVATVVLDLEAAGQALAGGSAFMREAAPLQWPLTPKPDPTTSRP